jgi:hypothetical protein
MKTQNIPITSLFFVTLALSLVCLSPLTAQNPRPIECYRSPIVGLWHVQYHGDFEGLESFDQWHSDGQEFESANAALGVLCQGTWAPVGRFGVQQFHTWWDFDPNTGQLDGYYRENQTLTVSLDGQSYDGTFLVREYDLNGNRVAEFTGTLHADRLTVHTPLP